MREGKGFPTSQLTVVSLDEFEHPVATNVLV